MTHRLLLLLCLALGIGASASVPVRYTLRHCQSDGDTLAVTVFKNARYRSLAQSVMPAVLAAVMASRNEGFIWWTALLAIAGVAMAHLAMNLADDWFDYRVDMLGDRDKVTRQGFRAVDRAALAPQCSRSPQRAVLVRPARRRQWSCAPSPPPASETRQLHQHGRRRSR